MRLHVLALAVLVLTAGCLTGSDDEDPVQRQQAQVTEDTGGIEGLITNPAIEPIAEATVTIPSIEASTTTAQDGSYAFSELEPDTYTLEVNASGYKGTRETVDVRAGEVSTADLVLSEERSVEGYTQTLELTGFFECGAAAGFNLSAAPAPANQSSGLISSPTCGTINDVSGNSTNDRFEHYFSTEANLQTLVAETTWEPSAESLSDQLWVDIVPEGFHCGSIQMCEWSLLDHWGENPLHGRVDEARLDQVQEHFDQQCAQGEDEWCGYDFDAEGWDLWIRVYPRWECQPAGPQACVLAQQEFSHVVTMFYNEPAPEEFTALE